MENATDMNPSLQGAQIFRASQWIASPREKVFAFFSDPKNLDAITPPWLHFRTLHTSTPKIQRGTRIDYALRIHGIPCRWRSEIAQWNPGTSFVDIQLRGPYALWHHEHRFEDEGEGTRMHDIVHFRMPFSRLSLGLTDWVMGPLVRHDIQKIFAHRTKRIDELFAASLPSTEKSLPPASL